MKPGTGRCCSDAQAACAFRYLASKDSPFFHTIKVTAAILRANVSRAMSRFHALGQQAQIEIAQGSGGDGWRAVAAPLKIFFRS